MRVSLKTPWLCAALMLAVGACTNANKENKTSDMADSTLSAALPAKEGFEKTIDGKKTDLYILKNKKHMQAAITNYGGRVVGLIVPDKDGVPTDVVIGFDNVDDYTKGADTYFGALIGRYGNRIAKGKFTLDGKEYSLPINNEPNSLHGGPLGFSRVVWEAKQLSDSQLELSYLAKDGEEGYPGNLNVKVTYTLTDENELKIDYQASTDKSTVVNLTNHSFFNLNGEGSGSVNNHYMQINADSYTPVDSTLIPTGKIESVKGTPFDFTTAATIGSRIDADNQQLKFGQGYDHNYVIAAKKLGAQQKVAIVTGDKSGIVMEVYTVEPGIQFYGGNFMDGSHKLKGGSSDDRRSAFCLETQHFPDSPNQPAFPSTVLKPGDTYKTSTTYKFLVDQAATK